MSPWNRRIVLPNETVIMPENVIGIIYSRILSTWCCNYDDEQCFIDTARFDNPTPYTDAHDVRIYERDRVKYTHGIEGIVKQLSTGEFIIASSENSCWRYFSDWTVTGHLSYAEDNGNG